VVLLTWSSICSRQIINRSHNSLPDKGTLSVALLLMLVDSSIVTARSCASIGNAAHEFEICSRIYLIFKTIDGRSRWSF